MKSFLVYLLWAVVRVSAQGNETNTTGAPTPAPPPTDAPTPNRPIPFEYMPWGDTNFGYQYDDQYYWTHQHAIRRPGWSWNEPLAGYAPFCYNQTCYSVVSACQTLGGTLLHDSYCSFPESVKIAGPSCWEGDCVAEGRTTCSSVGGITVGDGTVEWCLFGGDRTIFGPACYRGECHSDELKTSCDSLGGRVWNRNYCILEDYYTVIGPVCWGVACFASTVNDCAAVGGTNVAKWWCLVKGCDYTVIGPTCSVPAGGIQEQCFEDDTVDACNAVGGKLFAERFCLIEGTDWTLIGPNAFLDGEQINAGSRFCRELQDDIGPPFAFLESYDIGGRFCLVKRRLPPVGPYCLGSTCFPDNSTQFCEVNEGEENGPYMCALPPGYRRVEGPLVWNDEVLPSSAKECTGLFCAIPEPNVGENLRCPGSPLGDDSPASQDPDAPAPGGAMTSMNVVVTVLGLLVASVTTLLS